MRKEIIMSEQEYNTLKDSIVSARNTLDDEEKNGVLTGNGWYVLGLLNEMYETLVWGLKE